MKVEFSKKFSKDLDALISKTTKQALIRSIDMIEQVESLDELGGVKKLVGHKNAYRIRIGDYRLGFFVEDRVVLLGRFVHRKDIYKLFP